MVRFNKQRKVRVLTFERERKRKLENVEKTLDKRREERKMKEVTTTRFAKKEMRK